MTNWTGQNAAVYNTRNVTILPSLKTLKFNYEVKYRALILIKKQKVK